MIEKITLDEAMKQFGTKTEVSYVYGLDRENNQAKILTSDLVQTSKYYDYNQNLDELIAKDARVAINSQYDKKNPTAAKNPTGEWAVVESKHFPSGGLTMQILTGWFNPKIRKIRNHENGKWDPWMDL